MLREKILALEENTRARKITGKQREDFKYLTEHIRKIPIPIYVSSYGDDAESFAIQLRDMLNNAEFSIPQNSDQLGIKRDANINLGRPIGQNAVMPWAFVLHYGEAITNTFVVPYSFDNEAETNGFRRPLVTSDDTNKIYEAISDCFDQIGVSVGWTASTNGFVPGQYEIYVAPKSF